LTCNHNPVILTHGILSRSTNDRQSPYFFNAGLLYSGSLISRAAHSFASAIASGKIPEFDVLLGPAYKGISLAAVTTMTLYDKHGLDKAYCYNRKEKKDVGGPWLEAEWERE